VLNSTSKINGLISHASKLKNSEAVSETRSTERRKGRRVGDGMRKGGEEAKRTGKEQGCFGGYTRVYAVLISQFLKWCIPTSRKWEQGRMFTFIL
jgi:hypothetical protein